MIFLPLGLGTRLVKTPWVTLSLSVLLIASFLLDRRHETAMEKVIETHKSSDPSPVENLFYQYCQRAKQSTHECAQLSPTVAILYRGGQLDQKQQKDLSFLSILGKQNNMIGAFMKEARAQSPNLKKLPAYAPFLQAEKQLQKKVLRIYRSSQSLTRQTINLKTLLYSQIRHAGWMHVIGNLIPFIMFGLYVEARMGHLLFFAATAFAGSIGMFLQAKFFLPVNIPLVGASGNVMAVIGLSYALFNGSTMRIYAWFIQGRVLSAPVRYAIPILYLASDIVGSLLSTQALGERGSNIGHFAHLGGFAAGYALARLHLMMKPLPAPLLFAREGQLLQQITQTPHAPQKIHMASEVLSYNPGNVHARLIILQTLLLPPPGTLAPPPGSPLLTQLSQHLTDVLRESLEKGQKAMALGILSVIPRSYSFASQLRKLSESELLQLTDLSVQQKNWALALRLLEAYLLIWPDSRQAAAVRRSQTSIQEAVNAEQTMLHLNLEGF